MPKSKEKISAKMLDKKFDEGQEDILQYFDKSTASRRILVDFPEWMIESLDNEAKHLGISRQAIIKFWINEKIREISPKLKMVG
jgi:hypothetical protein